MKKKTSFLICMLAICMLFLSFYENTYAATKKSSIMLNKSKATVYTSGNKTVQLKTTVKGASKKVTWKSSNKKIATVNSKGKVIAKKAGSVKITAKANGVTAKCIITIKNDGKSVIELSNFMYDNSVSRIAKKIPGMKVKKNKEYKSYASRSKLSVGILKDAPAPYNPEEINVYNQITDINNRGYKDVTLYGVRIGDTYKKVKRIFQEHGIFANTKYSFYWGNAAVINTKFRNGKLVSYHWKLRYTG